MYKYKLKDGYNDTERVFINVGVTKGGVIESSVPLESSILELVTDTPAVTTPAPVEPAPVVGVVSQQNPEVNNTQTNGVTQ